jgi:hypothetical protein
MGYVSFAAYKSEIENITIATGLPGASWSKEAGVEILLITIQGRPKVFQGLGQIHLGALRP